jgi:hypothetical protein
LHSFRITSSRSLQNLLAASVMFVNFFEPRLDPSRAPQ